MAATALVALDEYLATTYQPDCDYIEGEPRQRPMPESDHGRMQVVMGAALLALERKHGFWVMGDTRVKVSASRFRVPDLVVARGRARPLGPLIEPPSLCIEILSPSDTSEDVQERVDDFLAMSVPYVWVVSPRTHRGWIHAADGVAEARDGILRTANPDIAVPLVALFESES